MIWHKGKCNDCGQPYETERRSGREDVCDGCWDNRLWLVKHPELFLSRNDEVRAIQRAMGYGRGTAKRKMEALKQSMPKEGETK